ncbi:MAG: arsenate reductase (glutaredoxin) [Lentimicrobiaceae bacterium]|nr:arsenate reductase (glutaredoxin) [Lentimicrobiaceae bacterium]
MIKIYHNPRCRKSRAGLQYLQDKGIQPTIIYYLKDQLGVDEIREILQLLNIPAADLVRTQEDLYRKQLKGKQFTEEEWIRILSSNPNLIQRPIVVKGHKAIVADPPARMDSWF